MVPQRHNSCSTFQACLHKFSAFRLVAQKTMGNARGLKVNQRYQYIDVFFSLSLSLSLFLLSYIVRTNLWSPFSVIRDFSFHLFFILDLCTTYHINQSKRQGSFFFALSTSEKVRLSNIWARQFYRPRPLHLQQLVVQCQQHERTYYN